jgi:porin
MPWRPIARGQSQQACRRLFRPATLDVFSLFHGVALSAGRAADEALEVVRAKLRNGRVHLQVRASSVAAASGIPIAGSSPAKPCPLVRILLLFNALLLLLTIVSAATSAQSQQDPTPLMATPAASSTTPPPSVLAEPSSDNGAIVAAPPAVGIPPEDTGIALNPRAVSGLFYSGLLQQALGLSPDSALRVGGIVDLGGNWLVSGGLDPHRLSGDFAASFGADVDMEKAFHIPGGEFYASLGLYQGTNANGEAGSVQNYDNLAPGIDFHRTELYELWWHQRLFDDKLLVKIGKINGTAEFDQVLIPVPIPETNMQDWTISDLLYAPVGLNPTLFGRLPGSPNTAWGVTASFLPTNSLYASYGLFDGNGARGIQTGLNVGPDFNSYKFNIGEVGYAWRLGNEGKPGRIGVGIWGQTGTLFSGNLTPVQGANGFYAFGSQRLWYQHPGRDPSGLIGFLQFGASNSAANIATRYVGTGLTGLGLVPGRPADSMGIGLAWSKLNPGQYAGAIFFPDVPYPYLSETSFRSSETMLQADYQLVLIPYKLVLQAAYTAIPTPGARPGIPWANVLTLRLATIF